MTKSWETADLLPRPEDIFGSVEVDSEGNFVDGKGHYQPSGKPIESFDRDCSCCSS